MKYDVAIVGGGLGGLSAGAYLALHGKKVLLVEQHNIVGGAATHFQRQRKMVFEVGLHEFDGLERESKQKLIRDLGLENRLTWVRVPEFYRIRHGSTDITVPDDLEAAKLKFLTAFPNEDEAVEQFFSDLVKMRQTLNVLGRLRLGTIWKLPLLLPKLYNLWRMKRMTANQYLEKLTSSFELQISLIANMGYFHDDPTELSMLLMAGGQSSYLTGGGWFVRGGSQMLSNELAAIITENQGQVITKHMVEEIVVENGQTRGISYRRKKRKDAELQIAKSEYVVMNAPLPTVTKLIPSLASQSLKFQSMQHGCSLLTIYISFSQPVKDLTNGIYSTFVYDEDVTSLRDVGEVERSDDHSRKGFVFVDYGVIDSGLETKEHYHGVICGIDHLQYWECLEKQDYKRKKEKVMEIYIDRLERSFPGIKARIAYMEMATAKTIKKYTLNPSGTVYGFAPTPNVFMTDKTKDIRSKVSHLEFASAWSHIGGFSSALTAGRKAAQRILKEMK